LLAVRVPLDLLAVRVPLDLLAVRVPLDLLAVRVPVDLPALLVLRAVLRAGGLSSCSVLVSPRSTLVVPVRRDFAALLAVARLSASLGSCPLPDFAPPPLCLLTVAQAISSARSSL
jgi:hypothetical protein